MRYFCIKIMRQKHKSLIIMRQEKYDPFISNYRIAKSVSTVLKDRSWSYRRCAYQFNQHHKGQKISVTKDLVSRVANQEFRIVNERIRLYVSSLRSVFMRVIEKRNFNAFR